MAREERSFTHLGRGYSGTFWSGQPRSTYTVETRPDTIRCRDWILGVHKEQHVRMQVSTMVEPHSHGCHGCADKTDRTGELDWLPVN